MEQEFIVKLKAIKNKFIGLMQKELNQMGLTRIEFEILNYIYLSAKEQKQVKASSLAKAFEVSLPAVLHKLDSLEEKNLIEKSTDLWDKRIKYYTLTKQTQLNYEKQFLKRKKTMEEYFIALDQERQHLSNIIEITLNFLEELYD